LDEEEEELTRAEEESLDQEGGEGEEQGGGSALGSDKVGDMRQWTDEASQVRSLQGAGASGGGSAEGGALSFHTITEAELEEAFGPLSGETPFIVEPILDPVYKINFGNIAELGKCSSLNGS